MTALPDGFLTQPIAHRALHDASAGRAENSIAACRAAIDAGYGIEIDVQLSRDGAAMVFHDYALTRLTGEPGAIRQRDVHDLVHLELRGGGGDTIPTLDAVLAEVAGRAPLLIEIKDQDGAMGPNTGGLERAVATALAGYRGDVAVMSFNPHALAALRDLAPDVPRGLITGGFHGDGWGLLNDETRARLRTMPDFDPVGASFISHRVEDLDMPEVAQKKARGVPVLCWTVRNHETEQAARRIADNITFEGYLPGQGA